MPTLLVVTTLAGSDQSGGSRGGLAMGPSGQLFLTDRAQNVVPVAEL